MIISNDWTKIFLAATIAFFGVGGACYDLPETVTSEKMVAAEVFTFYKITEYTSDEDKCSRSIESGFFGDSTVYQIEPPVRVTFNGAELKTGRDVKNEFSCGIEKAEFVLTDNQGGTKTDVYETKKVKFAFPAETDRAQDLRVPVEFDDKYDYEFEGWIKAKSDDEPNVQLKVLWVKNEAELGERLRDLDIPKNLSYFLRDEKLLVIPASVLSALAAGDQAATIKVSQWFFKPKYGDPKNALKSAAFTYEYKLALKLKLN